MAPARPILRRRTVMAMACIMIPLLGIPAVYAATPAEAFVADNIQKGLGTLNDPQLSAGQRSEQFERLLLTITDMNRVASFTLGQYAQAASPADRAAFAAAFQSYSVAVYRSYLGKYAGQTLKVMGSSQHSPSDFIVVTHMIDPADHSGQPPLEVDFRVRTDTGKPEITDLSVAGVWLAIAERDQFGAFLSKNHGDINALVAHLHDVANSYR
jgi:phospholipid transport system substrate-binding protein